MRDGDLGDELADLLVGREHQGFTPAVRLLLLGLGKGQDVGSGAKIVLAYIDRDISGIQHKGWCPPERMTATEQLGSIAGFYPGSASGSKKSPATSEPYAGRGKIAPS